MKWTIDGAAINRIAEQSSNYNAAFDAMTKLVADGELTFCDELVGELQRTAENEPGALWANTVKSQRQNTGAGMATLGWVMRNVKAVQDPEDRHDAAPHVIAQARALAADHPGLAVVTEDILEKPTRRALSDVCDELQIPWLQVPDWMRLRGVPWP